MIDDLDKTLGAAVIVSENSVQEPVRPEQAPAAGVRSGRPLRVLGLVAIVLGLVVFTSLGSVLVNVDWPDGGLAWLRVAIGAVLLTLALLCGELLVRIVYDLRRGRVKKNGNLDLLDRLGAALAKPKRVVAVLVIALVWFLVVWLTPPVFSAPKATPALEPGGLVIMSAIDESPSDPRRVLIEQWNQAHPENRVQVENVSGEPDAQHAAMVANARGERAPAADVYLLDVVWMTEFIERGYIRPLDRAGLATDDFLPNVLRTCTDLYGHRDGLWALPLNSDAGLLYHRTDLPGLPAPASWDDVFGAGAKSAFTAAKDTPAGTELVGANAAQLANEEVLVVTAFEAMWAAGGEVVNEDGHPVFNEGRDEVVFDASALEALRDLAAAYRDEGTVVPGADGMDETKATVAFRNEQAVYMRNWPVAYDTLTTSEGRSSVSFDVADLPGDSVLGGQNLAIARSTGKPKAAQAFIEFLTSAASQLILFEAGGFAPTRDSAYANATRPYKDLLRGAVVEARPRPFLPHYTEFSKEFRKGITRALRNDGVLEPDFPKELAKIANRR